LGADYVSGWIVPYFGDFDYYRANPELEPEHQQGSEGGIEFYLGNRASLVVTRYNQTVDALIAAPKMDSVRSNVPCDGALGSYCYSTSQIGPDGYGYHEVFQYLNMGSIRNQGWELQSTVTTGPVTTKGTYSWTKSRTIGVNPKYAAYFIRIGYRQYQPGATFDGLPEHNWALSTTYARSGTTVALNLMGTGKTGGGVLNEFYVKNFYSYFIRLKINQPNMDGDARYVGFNPPYTMADLNAAQRITSRIDGTLQIQNLTGYYRNDYYATFPVLGRQVKAGFRIR
jgi:outer membrane receptor protein involved in Fe transport